MKKISIIIFILSGIISFTNSCKKTDDSVNPLSDVKNLGVGAYLTLKSTTNLNFDYTALSTSAVGIIVDQKLNSDVVSQVVIYAIKGASYDTTTWKKIKTVPFVLGGTTLSVTGAELAAGLGVSLSSFSAGDFYTFYNRVITASGKQYDVSNTGNNNGSGLITGSNYGSAFTFTAYITCPFTGTAAGTYIVKTDDWGDWLKDDLVSVTDGPGTNIVNISKVWPNSAFGMVINPLLVKVDPATGSATVPNVAWGNYGSYNTSSAAGSSGYVFSCTGRITLTIHVVATVYGDQGNLRLILQKQ